MVESVRNCFISRHKNSPYFVQASENDTRRSEPRFGPFRIQHKMPRIRRETAAGNRLARTVQMLVRRDTTASSEPGNNKDSTIP